MTTIYSPAANGYRLAFGYDVTITNTTVTITYFGVESDTGRLHSLEAYGIPSWSFVNLPQGLKVLVKLGSETLKSYDNQTNPDLGYSMMNTISTKTINRTTAAQSLAFSFQRIDYGQQCSDNVTRNLDYTASTTITIPAKPSYKVMYNANGGSGAPSQQTKWYGDPLTLASGVPTRTNYVFKNWNTKADGSGTTYASGAQYTGNAALTLYAQWYSPYTVSYNVNGGNASSKPADQTKIYNQTLKLTTAKPTRENYIFSKWNTNASGTGTNYASGANYTANANATLYAQWTQDHQPPTISSLTAERCDANGDLDEVGTRCKVVVKWAVDTQHYSDTVGASVKVTVGSTAQTKAVSTASGTTSFAPHDISDVAITSKYTVTAVVTDSRGKSTTRTTTLPMAYFTMDFKEGGHGVAIGKPSTTNELLDVGYNIHADGYISLGTNTTAEENGIRVKGGGTRSAWLLRNISGSNADGDAVLLGNGGATIIGSGEAHNNLWNQLGITAGTEQLHLASDGNVYVWSNCNATDASHRARAVFTTTDSGTYPQMFAIEGGQASSIAVSNNANNGWTTTDANGTYSSMQLRDKNGYWTGVWGSYVVGSTTTATHGANCMYIGARNKTTSNTDVANYINLYVRKDGTRTVSVSDAAAWRSALSVPGIGTANEFTGGTQKQKFSGNKNWSNQDTVVDITKANNGLSSGTRYHEWLSYDKEALIPGGLTNSIASGGDVQTQVRCRNIKSSDGTTVVNNNIVLTVKKDGTQTVSVTSPAAWRTALGLGTYYNLKSIFYNETGVTGNVNLTETANNYAFLIILFKDNDGNMGSTMVKMNSSSTIWVKPTLSISYAQNGYVFIKTRTLEFTSSTATVLATVSGSTSDMTVPGTSTNTTNHIYVTQVLGLK